VLLADVEGQVVDANPAARRLLAEPRPHGRALDSLLETLAADPERSIEVERVPLRRPLAGRVGEAVLLTDRTEAVRLDRQLREQQRLESLGLLAGGLAHDFQNLLTGVLAGAGLARMTLEPRHPARKPLRDVVRGARTASRLVQQLLGLSGRRDARREPLSLSREVRALEDLLTSWLPKGVALELALPPDLPAVEADRTEIQQVVTNLAVNAAQAAGGRGLVRIRTAAAELAPADLERCAPGSAARAGRHVLLEVADDGCGMDEATQRRIFEPFFTTREGGHGLGLAAVLGIVHRCGGGVEVESAPGEGAAFRVWLPASDATLEAEATPVERELQPAGEGLVLVVEDEDALREIVAGALERMGYSVLRAEDGSEALELFRERADDVDLVLLDVEMPGVGGMEAWAALREVRADVRVVLTSAFRGDAPAAVSGAAAVLRKPYGLDELFEVVRSALDAGRRSARD
jgi:signal transduction histidine kinase/ActR/RegA family two-component response regulator